MNVQKCDPEVFKKVINSINDQFHKPRLVKEDLDFKLKNTDGSFSDCSLNMNHPMALIADGISKIIGQRTEFKIDCVYFERATSAFRFVRENEKQLSENGLGS